MFGFRSDVFRVLCVAALCGPMACGGATQGSADAGRRSDASVTDSGVPTFDAGGIPDATTTPDASTTPDAANPVDAGMPQPLGPGSLAFIGVNSDIPEGFALVALQDIPSGTVLRFTERAWNEVAGAFQIAEGTGTLTLSQTVTAGTVFEIGVTPPAGLSVTPDIGTIVNDDTGNWGIAGNGDNLFVYLGADTDPTFISGVAFSSPAAVWTSDELELDGQHSMIPSTLSESAGTITTFTPDNIRYTGTRTGQGSIAAYLALIADENNYEGGNAAYTPLRGASDFTP